MHLRLVVDTPPPPPPANEPWMRRALLSAAIYNAVWAGLIIAAPDALFAWLELPPPSYAGLWRCVGLIVGLYGVGYAAAASNPIGHWPITLVGLLGKLLAPAAFVIAALRGELSWRFGATLLTTGMLWWLPFALILVAAWRAHHHTPPATASAERLPSRKRA